MTTMAAPVRALEHWSTDSAWRSGRDKPLIRLPNTCERDSYLWASLYLHMYVYIPNPYLPKHHPKHICNCMECIDRGSIKHFSIDHRKLSTGNVQWNWRRADNTIMLLFANGKPPFWVRWKINCDQSNNQTIINQTSLTNEDFLFTHQMDLYCRSVYVSYYILVKIFRCNLFIHLI